MIKNSLNKKFLLQLALILLLLFLIMYIVLQTLGAHYIKKYVYENEFIRHKDVDRGTVSIINECSYLYARIMDEPLLSSLESPEDYQQKLNNFLSVMSIAEVNEEIFGNVMIYKDDFYSYKSGFASPSENFVRQISDSNQSVVIGGFENGYVLLGRKMHNPPVIRDSVIIFYIREKLFKSTYTDLDESLGYSFIITSDHYVISHADGRSNGKSILESEEYTLGDEAYYKTMAINGIESVVVISPLTELKERYELDLYIVSVLNYDRLNQNSRAVAIVLGAAITAILIVAFVFALRISKKIVNPIKKLSTALIEVKQTGDRKKLGTVDEGDELYLLEKSYDEMIDRIFDLMEKNREEVEMQRKLELDALQMQINPHFLYNTLDAIAWMAKIKRQPDIENLVLNLARFFRISLHKGDKFITVREEIELIKHFIAIELIRFPDKFSIEYQLDETIADCKVLKLLLQPVIENAIKHGVSRLDRKGNITIKAYGKDDKIIYEVSDDGVGFDINALKGDGVKSERPESGYGLKNVKERIKLEYGENYGLSIESQPGKGTKVTITVQNRGI